MPLVARFLLVGCLLLTVALSVRSFLSDYQVVFLLRGTLDDQVDRLTASGAPPHPASMRTTRDLMLACGDILSSPALLTGDPIRAKATAAACGRIADNILAEAPTNGRAQALRLLSDPAGVTAASLARARAAAPLEPWPLVTRITAVTRLSPLPPDVATAFLPDLERALGTGWGRDRVVALYTTRPDLRDPIRRATASLGPEDQAAFLRAARRLIDRGS